MSEAIADSSTTEGPARPFMQRDRGLQYKEAISILKNHEQYSVYGVPPVKPKGGDHFLISSGGKDHNLKNCSCDQYKWPFYNGVTPYPTRCKSPIIKKSYHKLGKMLTFQRHGWWLVENPHIVLVHYTGDETEYVPSPHGNSKINLQKEFVRTCPSVLKEIAENEAASSITTYQKLSTVPCEPELNAVLRPRNLRQVQNISHSMQQAKRLSRDDYYNTLLIAHELKDYVFQVITYPDLTCFVGLSELMKEVNNLLDVHSEEATFILT